ncbi:MAG: outer membrane protein assembly factor BamD [Alphaproteobacteria bacterium]|jgi:outer membrane protein assembly factor BamD
MTFLSRLRPSRLAVLCLLALPLAGCVGDEDDVASAPRPLPEIREVPPETLYANALTQLDKGNWLPCAASFDEVERQHPYSVWARRAILMSAFCYYQANKYSESIMAADRFITLHPGNKDAPYAYYLKAVSLYEQIVDVGRDQRRTEQSMAALRELIKRFPQTDYARDARLKLDLTKDHLAGKEMSIGRYYLKRGETVAAITRFRTVVEQYQTTSHVPEALHRLVECYLSLGVIKEAQTSAAVLGYNYPGSDWYEDTFALMQQYGMKANPGKPYVPAAINGPAVAPAADSAPVAAPKADGQSAAAKPDEAGEKKEESGGFFDWF